MYYSQRKLDDLPWFCANTPMNGDVHVCVCECAQVCMHVCLHTCARAHTHTEQGLGAMPVHPTFIPDPPGRGAPFSFQHPLSISLHLALCSWVFSSVKTSCVKFSVPVPLLMFFLWLGMLFFFFFFLNLWLLSYQKETFVKKSKVEA